MRIIFISCFLFLQINGFTQAAIEVSNAADFTRNEEVIEIPFSEILNVFPSIDTGNFIIINQQTKKQIPFQLEYKGSESVKNLLVQISMPAKSNLILMIKKGKPMIFASKTYGRYVPERKDDFAWENDKIAFRKYGKALENTPSQMAYGTDVWVKRTDQPVINDWYKKDDYHSDNGQGLDYYKVGLTLGAGDIAPYINDTIRYSKNYRDWKVLDNGPLRTTFQLMYEAWELPSQKVSCIKTISLDAGSQLNKIQVEYFLDETGSIPVAIGIVKRKEPGVEFFNEEKGIMAYWEPVHGKDGTTGVGCLFPKPLNKMIMNDEHLLTISTAKNKEPFVYYDGAAWDKAGAITSSHDWFEYLKSYKKHIDAPLKIKVSK